nr:MAG TPA: Putative head tail adaptor [Caudoviricetes sp.]
MNLNTKIDICTKVDNLAPVDELEPTYSTLISSIWAKKTRLLGKESIKIGLEHNTGQFNFIIRARKGITEEMFIRHENVIYNIVGYEELKDDKNYMLIATVRKQVIA